MQVSAEQVAAPLGLSGTYWVNTNSEQQRPANPHMSIGCISTPGDLCAITCMLAQRGRLPASSSGSSSAGGVLLQPDSFDELVKLQSAGDQQDLSWAFACVQNGQPIPAVSAGGHGSVCSDCQLTLYVSAFAAHTLRKCLLCAGQQACLRVCILYLRLVHVQMWFLLLCCSHAPAQRS